MHVNITSVSHCKIRWFQKDILTKHTRKWSCHCWMIPDSHQGPGKISDVSHWSLALLLWIPPVHILKKQICAINHLLILMNTCEIMTHPLHKSVSTAVTLNLMPYQGKKRNTKYASFSLHLLNILQWPENQISLSLFKIIYKLFILYKNKKVIFFLFKNLI